ncbi:MAG: lipoprotein insertase outer membrane protein LolB [Rhodospirillaceae bacterium]|nr:lipoprotein insertase outer membrane protein LolB [Rhodospirillaceae bacterium]
MRRGGPWSAAAKADRRRRAEGRSGLPAARAAALAGFVCVLAGGCETLPTIEDGLSYEERRSRLRETPSWRMNGRIAVNTGSEAFQGRFRWSQTEDGVELAIYSALGMNVLRVSGPPEQLTVTAGGDTWELADPEPELSAMLGWWLPVRSLDDWLLGYADPEYEADQQLDPTRTELRTLDQRLWRLTYQSYRLHEGLLLPRRIDLAHGALELRVFVDGWQPSS